MPIYMDVHIVPGVKAVDVAAAHRQDLLLQHEHGCKCMTYWIDEERESIFCLIEAPGKDEVIDMHNKAHGLIPNRIIEVNNNIVESFLGRIYDPENAVTTDDGLSVFHDPSFRVLVIIEPEDPVILQHRYPSDDKECFTGLIRETIKKFIPGSGGREAEYNGNGYILSFTSAAKAIVYAGKLWEELNGNPRLKSKFKIAIHGGEPLENSSSLFGDTILFAQHLCFIADDSNILLSNIVRDLAQTDTNLKKETIHCFPPPDEIMLQQLFTILENNWQLPAFDVEALAKKMAMSNSQLYRKLTSLTGKTPNEVIRNYRLCKAKDLLKKQRNNIAQVSFEAGFTSPSYFTKCFKQKFGLLPVQYLERLN